MPAVSYLIVRAMMGGGLLPTDPICAFAILLEASMPSAQNLVLLMQLREFTQPLAARTARLLLSQYTISIIPITLWITIWCSWLGIGPVSA